MPDQQPWIHVERGTDGREVVVSTISGTYCAIVVGESPPVVLTREAMRRLGVQCRAAAEQSIGGDWRPSR